MLRIEDARNKKFTKTHLREGYELAEVDEFRSDVVDAISLRERVISELQEQLAGARMHLADAGVKRGHVDAKPQEVASPLEVVTPQEGANPREGAVSAARMLELAAVTADQLVAEARAEASSLVSAAQAEADRVAAELAHRKSALEAKIEMLRQLENEHRSHLRYHFSEQLAQLEDDAPAMLRSVVAE